MNRLSRDVSVIDSELGDMLHVRIHPSFLADEGRVTVIAQFFILEIFWSSGIVFAIALVMPLFIVAALVLAVVFSGITSMYIVTSRELKRLESVTRSPIFGMVGESLNGIVTIRAYGDGPRFFRQLFSMLDANARPYWNLWLANRWCARRCHINRPDHDLRTG